MEKSKKDDTLNKTFLSSVFTLKRIGVILSPFILNLIPLLKKMNYLYVLIFLLTSIIVALTIFVIILLFYFTNMYYSLEREKDKLEMMIGREKDKFEITIKSQNSSYQKVVKDYNSLVTKLEYTESLLQELQNNIMMKQLEVIYSETHKVQKPAINYLDTDAEIEVEEDTNGRQNNW